MIQAFSILGERCSGTNFLEEAILTNFHIQITTDFGHKHFFPYDYTKQNTDDTLFIGIVREPIAWLYSFLTHPWEVRAENRDFYTFLFGTFYDRHTTNPRNRPEIRPGRPTQQAVVPG